MQPRNATAPRSGTPAFLRRFGRDRHGGIATIVAFAAIPMIAAAGVASDGLIALLARAELSSAVDAAALAGARSYKQGDVNAQVIKYISGNFSRGALKNTPSVAVGDPDGTVAVSATAEIPTNFMKLFGVNSVDVSASAAAQALGAGGMELSLVLDITGSMKGTKLETLKTSTNRLLNVLYGEKDTVENLAVAVVPFAGRVNIKPHREWMSTKPFLWQFWWGGCADERSGTAAWDDTSPSVTKFPEFAPHGSVFNTGSYCPPNPALPLTASKATVKELVGGLQASGNTRTDIGMSWGWRTLSPQWKTVWGENAKDPAEYDDPKIRKIVVLMTDGENTPDQSGDPESKSQTYTKLGKSCTGMKDNGIVIYTITFQAPKSIKKHYEDCATTPDHHYFDAPTEEELKTAFGRIGDEITRDHVRLVR